MLKSDFQAWEGFEGTKWKDEVNVRDFIQKNYTPYDGNEDFLADSSEATNLLWEELKGSERRTRQRRRSGYGNRDCIFSYSLWTWLYQ